MLFNLEDWENIIHFGNLFASIGKKTYLLALGTIPVTGVGFIARKITEDADQLHSNCAADQRLCFRYIDTTIPLLSKSEISSF